MSNSDLEAFELAKPPCRITTRPAGVEPPGWKLVRDGGFRRNFDGNDMAGWGVAIVSPENLVRIICGPVVCDLRTLAFLGATSCSNNTAALSGFAEAMLWANSFVPRGVRLRILFDSKHAASVTIYCPRWKEHFLGPYL